MPSMLDLTIIFSSAAAVTAVFVAWSIGLSVSEWLRDRR